MGGFKTHSCTCQLNFNDFIFTLGIFGVKWDGKLKKLKQTVPVKFLNPSFPIHTITQIPLNHAVAGTRSEGGRACLQFPCHCFHFLTVPDYCWCNVHEAKVKGKLRPQGMRAVPFAFPSLFIHMGSLCSSFSLHMYRDRGGGRKRVKLMTL